MDHAKRKHLKQLSLLPLLFAAYPTSQLFGKTSKISDELRKLSESKIGNFKFIYDNEKYRNDFFSFLVNVFHLYPEKEFHQLIAQVTTDKQFDDAIYQEVQQQLKNIKPLLSDLTYALPALNKQKKVITQQTLKLLPDVKKVDGYLEFGSTGRYLDELEEHLKIRGDICFIDSKPASFAADSIVDRGQLSKAGRFLPLNNYDTQIAKNLPKNSFDLVTVYIGFHHCPPHLREEFITSIRDVLKPNGKLIIRDHDASNEKMLRIVALAHDVFNLGTKETLEYNKKEERYFYSLEFLGKMMNKFGFKSAGEKLLQDGDPTLNTLMVYTKA